MIGILAAAQIAPCMADQTGGRNGFTRNPALRATNFPASTGRFTRLPTERSGPADLAAATTTQRPWRICAECGYDGQTRKAFRQMSLRANFQPLGGTFSYKF